MVQSRKNENREARAFITLMIGNILIIDYPYIFVMYVLTKYFKQQLGQLFWYPINMYNIIVIYDIVTCLYDSWLLHHISLPINYPMINLLNPTHWHKLAQLQFIFCYNSNQGVRNHTDSTQARLLTQWNKIYLLNGFKEWGYGFYRT